ncbi:MAG: glutamate synthase [Omnitrophica WOR_2 bacterium RIFCSPLOWO2_12_FULL_51_24]|nr:MAG: glutamate synthase [Omnitrophica WOR_2 bacterium RIFCSPLOWO2_02_FULL_50_19]OGX43358.1 MAG: glutamate synthase [Omnitrophica WOR_2 bacterium RIFCSPLOWO2_12_FULL_51_24]
MSFSRPNRSAATGTKNRYGEEVSPFSGMCVVCIDGCPGLCEIGKSAVRGSEVIYPQPFGAITAASQKDYPIDFSHFNIMGSAVGAYGIQADSNHAIFPNVNLEVKLGHDKKIKLRYPILGGGQGSTDVARNNWEGIAIGAAITGTIVTVGENVVGMDQEAVLSRGIIKKAPELERRVRAFKDWQDDGYGAVVVQANVEDTTLGVLEYAIDKLDVDIVELKWGQGAKDIGGEVKIRDLKKAQMLKNRGYVVLPDPEDTDVVNSFQRTFDEFERHSRVGMVTEEGFMKRVKELRKAGAKYIFLKTGAYRPADLARAIKFSSEARIDVLTVDGAGGGTGMSPWRMMNEWGIPTVEIESLTYDMASRLKKKGKHVPDIVIAGGLTLEDHVFKAIALGAPFVKAIGMARANMCAAMVGKTIGNAIKEENIPQSLAKYGKSVDEIFITSAQLKRKFGKRFEQLPPSAIGVYTYFARLAQGLRQLMAGERKFALEYITRDDIVALTREAAEISGIDYVMDADKKEVDKILGK